MLPFIIAGFISAISISMSNEASYIALTMILARIVIQGKIQKKIEVALKPIF